MPGQRELAALLVLAVVGTVAFGSFVTSSPAASVPLDHSQGEATSTATQFLRERGYDPAAFRTSTVFTSRGRSATFIQRQLDGSRERAALLANHVYGWETRFYRPLEPETFRVAVDARTGTVARFTRQVPDEAPGGNLSRAAALDRARAFLRATGHDLDRYERISSSSTERPNRVDHTFVWKHVDRQVASAPYYVEVTLHGERIGGYDQHLNVPDAFAHQYQVQQNRGLVLSVAFLGLSLLLLVAAIWFGLRYYKADAFDGRYALVIGGSVAGLTALGAVNSIPQLEHGVPTTIAPLPFLLIAVGGAVLVGIVIGAVAAVTAGAGKQLSAEVLGSEPLTRLRPLLASAERRRDVGVRLAAGVLLAGVVLGVYAGFYLVGTRFFDFWLPSQPPQVGAVTLYVPALAALVAGGTAALWEEVTYRLFAIPLTKRYLRYTALAVVLPATVWGLGHAGYAVLPFWARAVEVSLIGVVLGIAFLRYGVEATIAAHFTVNATVTAVPMLRAGTPWLVAQGGIAAAIALLPALAAVALYAYDRPAPDE